jgi:hypothetical protein
MPPRKVIRDITPVLDLTKLTPPLYALLASFVASGVADMAGHAVNDIYLRLDPVETIEVDPLTGVAADPPDLSLRDLESVADLFEYMWAGLTTEDRDAPLRQIGRDV